jgi:hypothetical protein
MMRMTVRVILAFDDVYREVGTIDIDPADYHRTLAFGLRGMAEEIEALTDDEDDDQG